MVWLRQAVASSARPRCIGWFESPQHKYRTNQKRHLTVAFLIGGPEEIRTPDPYNANVMRSQLRYRPISKSNYS